MSGTNTSIDKTPLKEKTTRKKHVEKNGVIYFKRNRLLIFFTMLVNVSLFGSLGILIYDIFIDTEHSVSSSLGLWIFVFSMSLVSIGFYFSTRKRYFFDKGKGIFFLAHDDFRKNKKKISDILGIQILAYQFYQRVPGTDFTSSGKELVTLFEVNVAMNDFKRYHIASYKKRNEALIVVNNISTLLKKPIFDEISYFESSSEKSRRLGNSFKSGFVLKDNFDVTQSKEELISIWQNEIFDIQKMDENNFIIDLKESDLESFSLGKQLDEGIFRPLKFYTNISTKNNKTEVSITTKFKYEFLIYVALCLLVIILNWEIPIIVFSIFTTMYWFAKRSEEKTILKILKSYLEPDEETHNLIK